MKKLYFCILLLANIPNAKSQCIPPETFYAVNTTFTSTDVTWSAAFPAPQYTVNYRRLDDTVWFAVSVFDDSIASIYNLDTCAGYEFSITSLCDEINQATSPSDTFFTKCDTTATTVYEAFQEQDMVLYPNPLNSVLNIRFSEPVYGDVVIFVRNGSGVMTEKMDYFLNGESEIGNIVLSEKSKGVNYLTVMYNGTMRTKQLFIPDI